MSKTEPTRTRPTGTVVSVSGARRAAQEAHDSIREFVIVLDEMVGDGSSLRDENGALVMRAVARQAKLGNGMALQAHYRLDDMAADNDVSWHCWEIAAQFALLHAAATLGAGAGAHWSEGSGLRLGDHDDDGEAGIYQDAVNLGTPLLKRLFEQMTIEEWTELAAKGAEDFISHRPDKAAA